MVDMARRRPVSPVTTYIAHLIKEGEAREGSMVKYHQGLLKHGSISRTQLINVCDGTRGAGSEMQEMFAKIYFGGSLDKLRESADRHAKTYPVGTPSPLTVHEDVARRTNRRRAEAAAVALGHHAPDVRRWADAVARALPASEDPDAETWWLPRILSEGARARAKRSSRSR